MGGYWLMASFNHFKNLNYMSEYAKARGAPSPKLAVAGTGVILLVGGLSMLLGVHPVVGIILLIVFLLGLSFQIHSFWKVDDAQMKQIDMINFTQNMALVGKLLMFLLLPRPWPMSLGPVSGTQHAREGHGAELRKWNLIRVSSLSGDVACHSQLTPQRTPDRVSPDEDQRDREGGTPRICKPAQIPNSSLAVVPRPPVSVPAPWE